MKYFLLALVLSALPVTAQAVSSVTFSSSIIDVGVDDGTSIYTGVGVGNVFSSTFIFGDTAGEATSSDISGNVAEYFFAGAPFESSVMKGSLATAFDSSVVEIDNDAPISSGEADLLNDLFGTGINGGDLFDSWATFGGSDTEGIEFGVILWFNTAIYSDLDLKTSPPALSQIDAGIFFLIERDNSGVEKLRAIGSLDRIVPVPPAIWLFGSALCLLGGIKRRPA